jgi:hypothetical protein
VVDEFKVGLRALPQPSPLDAEGHTCLARHSITSNLCDIFKGGFNKTQQSIFPADLVFCRKKP